MKETWIKLCLILNFIQDEGKKCIQMRQDIEKFEVMQICMHNELFKWNTILTAYRVLIVTHNELRTSAPKSFDEVWVQDNTASSSWPGLSNETKDVRLRWFHSIALCILPAHHLLRDKCALVRNLIGFLWKLSCSEKYGRFLPNELSDPTFLFHL